MPKVHLMTQRDQPFGSVRRCCEMCGIMIAGDDWNSANPDDRYVTSVAQHDSAQRGGYTACTAVPEVKNDE